MRWTFVLFPFAILYDAVTRLRNHLYNIGSKPSFSFEANVISVGNLSVGGTGKSPMIAFLLEHLLPKGLQLATLSRGYGRKTRGYIEASDTDDADTMGDEPAMYQARYGDQLIVTVCEERALAIPQILTDHPAMDIILLDDAFQHRTVIPSISILLTTFEAPFYHDFVLPAGRLREARNGANRADILLVTKCPRDITKEAQSSIGESIRKYAPKANIFFTSITYQLPVPMKEGLKQLSKAARVIGVAGIANASEYLSYLEEHFTLISSKSFADHKSYQLKTVQEVDEIAFSQKAAIVLTEKDAVKWKPFLVEIKSPVYFLPIAVSFIDREKEFLSLVDSSIKNYDRDY